MALSPAASTGIRRRLNSSLSSLCFTGAVSQGERVVRRWVDTRSYFGFDRRGGRGFRVFDRRVVDLARSPPFLPWLLGHLEADAANLSSADRGQVEDYSRRLSAVAELARVRKEERVAHCLEILSHELAALAEDGDVASLCKERLRGAVMALR
jgi:hypothetical protein